MARGKQGQPLVTRLIHELNRGASCNELVAGLVAKGWSVEGALHFVSYVEAGRGLAVGLSADVGADSPGGGKLHDSRVRPVPEYSVRWDRVGAVAAIIVGVIGMAVTYFLANPGPVSLAWALPVAYGGFRLMSDLAHNRLF